MKVYLKISKPFDTSLVNFRLYRAKIDVSRTETVKSAYVVAYDRPLVADAAAQFISFNRRAAKNCIFKLSGKLFIWVKVLRALNRFSKSTFSRGVILSPVNSLSITVLYHSFKPPVITKLFVKPNPVTIVHAEFATWLPFP